MVLKTRYRHVTAGFRIACSLEILHSVIVKQNKKLGSNLQLRHNFILCFTIIYVKFLKRKGNGESYPSVLLSTCFFQENIE
jgi:hypothetical protein